MIKALGYAASHSYSSLKRIEFEPEDPKPIEVEIEILYCGVCHSDIHQAKNEWSNTVYPCMPGHEIVGRIRRRGAGATRFADGDLVGVGCMIDSCRQCPSCQAGDQNYCEGPNSFLATYNGPMVPAKMAPTQTNMYGRDNTYGGYSNVIVVREDFVLKIPAGLKPEVAAPLLCAGVTTYSPLKHWKVGAGDPVAIVGFGGLGHVAAKLAQALGAEVTVFTSTEDKLDAARRLGFRAALEDDKDALAKMKSSFSFILSTIPEKHDLNPFVQLLKRDGAICAVGALEKMEPLNNMPLALQRKSVAGSLIGNIADTQEVLEFCSQHQIGPEIELVNIEDVNDCFKKVEKGEVRFRYVIDMGSLI